MLDIKVATISTRVLSWQKAMNIDIRRV